MTQHDSPSLHAYRPGTSRQAPDDPGPSLTTRPWMPALLYTLGFLTVYLLAICTPWGQRAENALFHLGKQGGEEAWIYPLSGSAYGSTPLPPMELTAKPTLMVGLAVIVVLTLVRRCWRQGCAALGIVILTTGGKEVFKSTMPRPDLVGAPENLLDQGFPSGHTAIPAALTLAAVLVVSPRIRPYVATAGVLWLACIAAATATMGGHRPSEVLGATLLACACYGLATWLLPPAAAPGATLSPRALPAISLTLALAIALVSGARSDTLTRSLVSATTAFICAALVWYAAVGRPAHTARRTRPALG
ncbi:phosphatase PAP2 family protein [Streptomyces stelliscabiei]|uniref:phosphatase PAP2 family protein n=1 Tax=Streptomyces stelliscabiei TaxID=146820 RepID=UPI0029BA4578|nr:phosphatase PAP2 family protein [Streptomyces stelliscabiei]MDX2550676.1 phosphatase PAP2 family protein [Streptomyces stelliscabiei]MDX2610374.1 phosphatase PAP2 family protein [Streptomyces stelliscabiei]MDX2634705.1 phosphatase PAP2 family protein [Streptomyces stelliscabiei]MDX2659651.1 phosphatase PAP2 family protein [Streptomyces stelliscabiei]MDX2715278.1 phosphatase PAP2 family protein [Streptomyces stelliscabiei]